MLKNLYPILATALVISSITNAYAADICQYTPGAVTCGVGTVSNVTGMGNVSLNGTIVTGEVAVNGSLVAKNTTLNKVIANGSLVIQDSTVKTILVNGLSSLTNTKVSGASSFNGPLNSVGSSFLQPLKINTSNSIFDNTSTVDITVTATKPPVQQKLILQNSTKVMGSITFQQGNGLVYASSDSKITGQVSGGTQKSK